MQFASLRRSRRQIIQPRPLQLNSVIADTEKMLRRLIGRDIELLTVLQPSLGTVMAIQAGSTGSS
jgi:hypothetical protein